jgi:hypothetical protein
MVNKMRIKVINTDSLPKNIIDKIETTMIFTKWWEQNDTMFCQLENSKGDIIRIFPERIKPIDLNESLDDVNEISKELI